MGMGEVKGVPIGKLHRLASNELVATKVELDRLMKGVRFLNDKLEKSDAVNFMKGARQFKVISDNVFYKLEKMMFIQDFLTTGKTVVIGRDGKPIKIEDVLQMTSEEMRSTEIIDPFHIESMKSLSELFGDSIIDIIELR